MMLPNLPPSFPVGIIPETLSGTIKPNEYATFPVPGLSSLKRG